MTTVGVSNTKNGDLFPTLCALQSLPSADLMRVDGRPCRGWCRHTAVPGNGLFTTRFIGCNKIGFTVFGSRSQAKDRGKGTVQRLRTRPNPPYPLPIQTERLIARYNTLPSFGAIKHAAPYRLVDGCS